MPETIKQAFVSDMVPVRTLASLNCIIISPRKQIKKKKKEEEKETTIYTFTLFVSSQG